MNYIYKLKPCDSWRIAEHESWFSYLASNGYFLESTGIRFAKFRKDEPKKMKYRIEVSPKPSKFDKDLQKNHNPIDEAQKSMYEECGWTYVDNWNPGGSCLFHVFSSPEELDAPELHTDPTELSYNLTDLDRTLRKNSIFTAISGILLLYFSFSTLFRNNTPYLDLMNNNSLVQPLFILTIVYLIFASIKGAVAISNLKKNLSQGIPLKHNVSWRKSLFISRFFFIVYVAIFILYLPLVLN